MIKGGLFHLQGPFKIARTGSAQFLLGELPCDCESSDNFLAHSRAWISKPAARNAQQCRQVAFTVIGAGCCHHRREYDAMKPQGYKLGISLWRGAQVLHGKGRKRRPFQ